MYVSLTLLNNNCTKVKIVHIDNFPTITKIPSRHNALCCGDMVHKTNSHIINVKMYVVSTDNSTPLKKNK